MLKRLFMVIMMAFLAFPLYANADTTTSCKWVGNSFQCNTQEDIQSKLDALKSQYGSTNYYICYAKSGLGGSMGSDPYTQNSGYSYMKYCLETMALADKVINKNLPSSTTGTSKVALQCNRDLGQLAFQSNCKTVSQICKQLYGPLSDDGSVNRIGKQLVSDDGGAIDCRCVIGSSPNPGQTVCVALTAQNTAPVQQQQNTGSSSPPTSQNASNTEPATPQEESEQLSAQPPTQDKAPNQVKKPSLFRRILNFFKSLFKFRFGHDSRQAD